MGMENCIYLKTVHLNTKNATLVSRKDTNSHSADLEGEIIQKIKKLVQYITEQATTEKVQRKYINILSQQ